MRFVSSSHCIEGSRRKNMQDVARSVEEWIPQWSGVPLSFFGVFDGHGGNEPSVLAGCRLPKLILRAKESSSTVDTIVLAGIKKRFIQTNDELRRQRETWVRKKPNILSTAGTTATVALLQPNKLFIGHVGDSAAILIERDSASPITHRTTAHVPSNEDERLRIERTGGTIVDGRLVLRALSEDKASKLDFTQEPSRSLGDFGSYNPDSGCYIVSAEPELHAIPLDNSKAYILVLATDGLWTVMEPDNVASLVKRLGTFGEANIAKQVALHASALWNLKHGPNSGDDISVIVAVIGDWQ